MVKDQIARGKTKPMVRVHPVAFRFTQAWWNWYTLQKLRTWLMQISTARRFKIFAFEGSSPSVLTNKRKG